jgi:hypothetical protein
MPINGPTAQILEIIDRQEFFGQEVINRYWYRLDAISTPDIPALVVSFLAAVVTPVRAIQSDQLQHLDTTVINHTDPFSFGTVANGATGILADPAILPPFCAFGVRLLRTSRDMRNGHKRIAGMQENYQDDGFLEPGIIAGVAGAVSGMAAVITESIRNYSPVVVRNRPTINDPAIDPLDTATWRYTLVAGVALKNAVTTQNSRKF